jgi:5-methylcytosine-specific restriction protein A
MAALEKRRPSARERGYGSEWAAYRSEYLRRRPSCCECGAPATVVDHIKPVKDGGSFWDPANHQPLCFADHAAKTMRDVNSRMRVWA